MAWIAIDVGTSVIKVVAFSSEGVELALCRESTAVLRSRPEYSEQSMEAVFLAVLSSMRIVLAQLQEPIEGVALTAQGDGCWLVDKNGNPTGNAILWNDGRASDVIEAWRAEGIIESTFRVSGSVSYPGLANAIIRWLELNDPDRLQRSRYALSCNGWIYSKLTGRFIADLSDGSNPFSDVSQGKYSEYLLQAFGVGRYSHLLPEIMSGNDLIGELITTVADKLGLPAGTPVVMAPYDIVATAYGAGVTQPKQSCVILGTTICAEAIVEGVNLRGDPTGTTIALGDGLYLRAMPTLTGCETLEWARELLGSADLNELEQIACQAAPGSGGLIFLPYLSPAGERAPFLDPRARGSLHKMSLAHGRPEIARSFYEGLAFAIRECLNVAADGVREVRVCGGGARSNLWCQIIADVTALDVLRPEENELGAKGAMIFGIATLGRSTVSSVAERFPIRVKRFAPHNQLSALYRRSCEEFQAIREHAREQWGESR